MGRGSRGRSGLWLGLVAGVVALGAVAGCGGRKRTQLTTVSSSTTTTTPPASGPSLTAAIPVEGPPGTAVTLLGDGFGPGTVASFGGVTVGVSVIGAGQGVAIVPALPTGFVSLTASSGGRASNGLTFLVTSGSTTTPPTTPPTPPPTTTSTPPTTPPTTTSTPPTTPPATPHATTLSAVVVSTDITFFFAHSRATSVSSQTGFPHQLWLVVEDPTRAADITMPLAVEMATGGVTTTLAASAVQGILPLDAGWIAVLDVPDVTGPTTIRALGTGILGQPVRTRSVHADKLPHPLQSGLLFRNDMLTPWNQLSPAVSGPVRFTWDPSSLFPPDTQLLIVRDQATGAFEYVARLDASGAHTESGPARALLGRASIPAGAYDWTVMSVDANGWTVDGTDHATFEFARN